MRYETDTADLTNGDGDRRSYNEIQSTSGLYAQSLSTTLQRAIREQREKMDKVRQRGLLGTVTIEDIQTVPTPLPDTNTESENETP